MQKCFQRVAFAGIMTFFLLLIFITKTTRILPVVNGTLPRYDRAKYPAQGKTDFSGGICYAESKSTAAKTSLACVANAGELFKDVKFGNFSSNLSFIGFNNFTECQGTQVPDIPEVPVIVTAASQNHYHEAVALCDSINKILRQIYKDVHLFIYDLGIPNSRDRENLERFCGCKIRKFPFSSFPKHVSNVQGYTWKPLIISLMLKEFPYVMWVDTSIRFDKNKNIQTLFEKARVCDIQQLTEPDWALGETSDPKTMQFFNLNIQDFLNITDVESGWGVYLRTKFLMQGIIKPWVKCALTYGCMLTDTYSFATGCNRPIGTQRKAGLCHRFDQTVLGVILTSIYKNNINNVLFGEKVYGNVFRGHTMTIPPYVYENVSSSVSAQKVINQT